MVNHELAVSAYHYIKNSPEHWDQANWACGSGMCLNGWLMTLSGTEWTTSHLTGADEARRLPWWQPSTGEYSNTEFYYAGARLLGIEDAEAYQLFSADNTLADIREILGVILGYDPEAALPSEDILLEAKHLAKKYYG